MQHKPTNRVFRQPATRQYPLRNESLAMLRESLAERTRELTDSQTRVRELDAELNVTEQRERLRLATDLHDYLAQLLVLTKMRLREARQLPMDPVLAKMIDDLESTTDAAIGYTRTLIAELRPPDLANFSLHVALQWLAGQMEQHNLAVSLQIKNEIPALPEKHALLVFQSVRELLLNCVKHSGARAVTVTLGCSADSLCIEVSDAGAGFDVDASDAGRTARGFGLLSIRERMLSLDGRFDLKASPGKGTTATLVLPVSS